MRLFDWFRRRRQPEIPDGPRYTLTTEAHYDYDKAIAGKRRAEERQRLRRRLEARGTRNDRPADVVEITRAK